MQRGGNGWLRGRACVDWAGVSGLVLGCMQLMNTGVSETMDIPSGKRPLSPVSVFFPRNHPSPKSSSRSISSMRSPRARLSSSGLRAWNSSAATVSNGWRSRRMCRGQTEGREGAEGGQRAALTHDEEQIARADVFGLRPGGHGHDGSQETGMRERERERGMEH